MMDKFGDAWRANHTPEGEYILEAQPFAFLGPFPK
jgi:hypothetical protein